MKLSLQTSVFWAGRAGSLSSRTTPASSSEGRREGSPRLEITRQFGFVFSRWTYVLASQSALRLRESLGAKRRVSREPSLGDSTSAGAESSQAALHALQSDRPTMTAFLQRLDSTLAFALLSPSESNVLETRSTSTENRLNCDCSKIAELSLRFNPS